MIRMYKVLLAVTAVMVLAISASSLQAEGYDTTFSIEELPGTEVGLHIPHDLNVQDQQGQQRSFKDLTGRNGLILSFTRSVDWCPYCQMQAINLNKKADEFDKLGYNIAMVSYEPPHNTKPFSDKNDIRYPILSDTSSEIIKSFKLLNEEYSEGSKYYGIPHPAIFVISNEGVIMSRHKEDGYKNRPDLNVILQDLQN